MKTKLSFANYTAIGFMLFALFFGAGNLIFPAQLGQNAGTNFTPAIIGFLITGVGLPLLGVLAIGFSGSKDLQELSSRVSPGYGIFFTSLLYLTIGPFFAIPRTGTVAFEVGIAEFIPGSQQLGLFIYTLIFFFFVLIFSLYPGRLVDNIGKIMAPALVILLAVLLITAYVNPMSPQEDPIGGYVDKAFMTGFLEGYNTMDALAALVFAIIVISAVRTFGVTDKKEVLAATTKSGLVATALLALIYVGIGYLGSTTTGALGLFDNGGPVLSGATSHYFGNIGSILLAIMIILACLTTAVGLIASCANYFNGLIPKVSYKQFAVIFTTFSFVIANFGLSNIINFSIPVLMFLYPLAIVIMILAFLSPLFRHARIVYVATIGVTFILAIFDGLKTLCGTLGMEIWGWMVPFLTFFENYLPLYNQGIGWLIPALIVIVITGIIGRSQVSSTQEVK